jgi:hypothetical protein
MIRCAWCNRFRSVVGAEYTEHISMDIMGNLDFEDEWKCKKCSRRRSG